MSQLTRWLVSASMLVVSVSGAPGSRAFSAGPPACAEARSICAEFDAATMVFVATVQSVSPEFAEQQQIDRLRQQSVTFEILEGFKGTASGYESLIFDASIPDQRVFTAGETVVVYARSVSRSLWSVACTRSRRIKPDDPEVAALRELTRRSQGAAVEGSLRVFEGSQPPALPPATPLEGLSISIESLDRSESLSVSSQTGGYFLVPWLEPGRYRIKFDSDRYVPVTRDFVIGVRTRCDKLDPIVVRSR